MVWCRYWQLSNPGGMARKERSKKRRKSRELNAVGKKRTKAGISDQINNIRAGAGLSIAKTVSTIEKPRSKEQEERREKERVSGWPL